MGRQKTLWIDEECWKKLEAMEGESISDKVRRAIHACDVADDARVLSLKRLIDAKSKQIAKLEKILKGIGWQG
jgi:predicted CopG family antitoxin